MINNICYQKLSKQAINYSAKKEGGVMNQSVASSKQLYIIKLPENYYSETDSSNWYDYKLIDISISNETTPTERFIDSIYDQLPINDPNHLMHRKKKALNNIICNLLNAYRYNLMLSISRDRTKYSIPKQYGIDHYTHSFIVINGIDVLDKDDYIYQKKGYYDIARGKGVITRICATEKLINKYYTFSNVSSFNYPVLQNHVHGSNIIYIKPRFQKLRFSTPILLKTKKKKLISYLPVKEIRRMRENLNEYNSLLSNSTVTIPYTYVNTPDNYPPLIIRDFDNNYPIDRELNEISYYKVLDTYLYRVFNNSSFKQGGRFYGAGYQGYKDKRKLILINENPTVECDYKAIHPRMCYHLLKIEHQDDPYSAVCDKDELRKPTKILMNMMLNAKDNNAAIGAFKKWLDEEKERREILDRSDLDGRKLLQKILDTHTTISSYFNSGKGVELQYLDSCIAEAVLMHFTKQGIPCLCIHDSFIVEDRYRDELADVMKEEYKRLIGFNCKIKFNK